MWFLNPVSSHSVLGLLHFVSISKEYFPEVGTTFHRPSDYSRIIWNSCNFKFVRYFGKNLLINVYEPKDNGHIYVISHLSLHILYSHTASWSYEAKLKNCIYSLLTFFSLNLCHNSSLNSSWTPNLSF